MCYWKPDIVRDIFNELSRSSFAFPLASWMGLAFIWIYTHYHCKETCKDKVIIVVQILGILVHTNTQKKKCIVVYIKSYLCILEQQKLLLRLTLKIRCWKLIHVYKSRVCGLPCWKDLRFPPNVFFFFFKLHGGSKIHRQQVYVPVFFIYHQLAQ